ncbi:MAG: TOBE domain-containing protein [Campylobacterota bacterium]|nr:TOBE domain-containing protein [Campylobacterota bacterium]
MSKLVASVLQIEKYDSLHIVKFECNRQTLMMMSLDLAKELEVGTRVSLCINPSHIAIAKNLLGELSYANQLACSIIAIDNGELLSSIQLKFANTTLESIITLSSSQRMNLQVGDHVTVLIKASELSMVEIL